jgi:type I restriction enzyme M protein
VGLPGQLFPTTGIPVCILVFDKAREPGGLRSHVHDIFFIDASRDFEPGKKQNRLRDEDVNKVIEAYRGRDERERYSHKANLDELIANNFNLNIPRYVDTFEPEPEVDLQAVQTEIRDLEGQLAQTREKMQFYLKELGINV